MGLPTDGGLQKPVPVRDFQDRVESEVDAGAKIPNKFGAKKVKNDQGEFDSKHEAKMADQLLLLQNQGYISALKVDKRELMFALDVNGVRICQYEADGAFTVERAFHLPTLDGQKAMKPGESYVVDAKSKPTRAKSAYVIKRNLMMALYKIKILEV